MKKSLFCLLLHLFTISVFASPPVPPTPAQLVTNAPIIAIVTITNLTIEHFSVRTNQVIQQKADLIVEEVLKGSLTEPARLRYYILKDRQPGCHPPMLFEGRCIVFPSRDGEFYARSDDRYSLVLIRNNQVEWFSQPESLSASLINLQKLITSP
jgi:hypothetical protein